MRALASRSRSSYAVDGQMGLATDPWFGPRPAADGTGLAVRRFVAHVVLLGVAVGSSRCGVEQVAHGFVLDQEGVVTVRALELGGTAPGTPAARARAAISADWWAG